MTISTATLVLWSIICGGLGASISAVIVAKDEKHYYKTIIERLQDLYKDAKQEADNWRHWTNVYRRMLDEAEKRNTIIINEQPKGANIPKFGD